MILDVVGKTDIGRVRKNNEDNFCIDKDLGLLIVADGVGGMPTGETASKIAVEVIRQQLKTAILENKEIFFNEFKYNNKLSEKTNKLAASINLANRVIFELSQKYPQNRGMATTCVACLIDERKIYYCNVGDSRLYLIYNNEIKQLTEDHSLVMEQVRKGLITIEQAEKSEYKNIITRALGNEPDIEIDMNEMELNNDVYFLLCTDGLTGMVDNDIILKTFIELKKPADICNQLFYLANENGGRDNITVIIANIKGVKPKNIFNKMWEIVKK